MTERKRPWFLTVWISLLLISSLGNAIMYFSWSFFIFHGFFESPSGHSPVLLVFLLAHLVCVIALFYWKKWGFWGVIVSSVVFFLISLSNSNLATSALVGLIGTLILFFLLHTGKENKAWLKFD